MRVVIAIDTVMRASILSLSKTQTEIVGRVRPFLKITVHDHRTLLLQLTTYVIISARGNERRHATIF